MKQNAIAIITARGGSKRIPHKNIKEFCGKPIIAYSIKAALESGLFEEVMVSTDDPKIAEIAKEYGANVPFMRSAENANDFATTSDVLNEVMDVYRKNDKLFDYVCCIYPTAPFITAQKLREAFSLLAENDVEQGLPVVRFSFPPQRCFIVGEDSLLHYKWPKNQPKRSQDLEPFYHDAGQFYCFKANVFYEHKNPAHLVTKALILLDLEVQDIDNEEDWAIAEMKYQLMVKKAKR